LEEIAKHKFTALRLNKEIFNPNKNLLIHKSNINNLNVTHNSNYNFNKLKANSNIKNLLQSKDKNMVYF